MSTSSLDNDNDLLLLVKHKPNLNRKLISSNWSNFKATTKTATSTESNVTTTTKISPNKKNNHPKKKIVEQTKYPIEREYDNKLTGALAIDCEMVGIGPNGQGHMLARVSIVNELGKVIIDKYVKPTEDVIDYRTPVSGIRPKDIECGEEFRLVQSQVASIIRNRILVGHALKNDFDVLHLNHPKHLIRDTSRYNHLKKMFGQSRNMSLKNLALQILDKTIQTSEHDSVEDAWTAMEVYKKFKHAWERDVKRSRQRYE